MDKKTRPFKNENDWICPMHGKRVCHRVRSVNDEDTGKKKYAGEYYACPDYWECKYYVSPYAKDGAVVAVIDVADDARKVG